MRDALVWFVVAFACAGSAGAQDALEVTDPVNVRTGPATSYPAIMQASPGQVYPALGRSGDWVRLQVGDTTGWSHASYLRGSSSDVLVVAAEELNVRSGPAARFRRVGALTRGARVAIRETQGEWRRIDYMTRSGWVHGAYLAGLSARPPPVPSQPRSRAGFIELAAEGPGYVCYSSPARRWGTPRFVYGIERIARRWSTERSAPRLQIGDLSAMNGGRLPGHASHRLGVDCDLRPMRGDGREGPVTRFDAVYSRALTQRVIDLFLDELPVTRIYFNDASTRRTSRWPNHDNHLHVRIRR